jgi:hypothetical protein
MTNYFHENRDCFFSAKIAAFWGVKIVFFFYGDVSKIITLTPRVDIADTVDGRGAEVAGAGLEDVPGQPWCRTLGQGLDFL